MYGDQPPHPMCECVCGLHSYITYLLQWCPPSLDQPPHRILSNSCLCQVEGQYPWRSTRCNLRGDLSPGQDQTDLIIFSLFMILEFHLMLLLQRPRPGSCQHMLMAASLISSWWYLCGRGGDGCRIIAAQWSSIIHKIIRGASPHASSTFIKLWYCGAGFHASVASNLIALSHGA